MWIFLIISGFVADILRTKHILETTNVRKLVNAIGRLYQTHFFAERFPVCLSAEFVHRVRCAFELIMIRENITFLSVPGVQLTAEDCSAWCISQLLS